MGDRWVLSMDCPSCSYHDDEIYYAPTCGFTQWVCPSCHNAFEIMERFELVEIKQVKEKVTNG